MSIKQSQPGSQREWMDLRGATAYAAVSERTLREWIHRAQNPLPASRVGAKLLISRRKFDIWMEQHQIKPLGAINVEGVVDEMLQALTRKN